MSSSLKIGVIGGGSWATAIVKILCENVDSVNWWMRNEQIISHIRDYGHNPNYISSAELHPDKLTLSSNVDEVINASGVLILAVPSAFIKETLKTVDSTAFQGKVVFSAIKGIEPESLLIVGEFINQEYNVSYDNIGVITGPCHAEEVAMEKLSYLTIASQNQQHATRVANALNCRYISTTVSDDIYGTEYAAVLKNVIAVACGICHGLGYGDNFQAVLIANAIQEIKRFVDAVHPITRDIKDSAYLGDLLVTCYSQFSRNRMFGNMLGKGNSVRNAQAEMNMVAEGYYATKCVQDIKREMDIDMPITDAVYNIIYIGKDPGAEMKKLSRLLS